jgi:hypothetical protein
MAGFVSLAMTADNKGYRKLLDRKNDSFPRIFTGSGMAKTLPARSIDLAELGADAADFAAALRSAATERACRSDWADFTAAVTRALLRLSAETTF